MDSFIPHDSMTFDDNCIVCGAASHSFLYPGIKKCGSCGHVFADTQLSNSELSALYKKNYFFGSEYSNYLDDKAVLQKNFMLRWKVLQRFIDPRQHQRLLEIGCAYGFFLEIAKPFFNQSMGIDITEDGISHAKNKLGLNATMGHFPDCDLENKIYDVVCMWDTIEHLREPHRYLQKIAKHTQDGAILALTTGDIRSTPARIRKQNWRLIHPPTHLHYFSARTIGNLLEKYNFEILYRRYCGFYRSIDNIAYNILVLRHQNPRVYHWLQRWGLTRFYCYLNTFDIMYIIARKRSKIHIG
jgi:2-polyprenyl-3-methyl-5-hydroxy-6-metoxy-1,4-benzoquinol methylase